jgi:hypothetical protein
MRQRSVVLPEQHGVGQDLEPDAHRDARVAGQRPRSATGAASANGGGLHRRLRLRSLKKRINGGR